MKKVIIILSVLSTNLVFSQNISSTFQGQIAGGDAQFFLHVEATGGTLTGFYKYQTDSLITPLKGTVDADGNFMLTGIKKPYPVFSGKWQNRLVKGTFRAAKNATPQPFYAVNCRGEYSYDTDFSLILSANGYQFVRYDSYLDITAHLHDDKIYLLCDSLNIKWLLIDSIWMTENKYPLFINNEGEEVGAFLEEWLEGDSRIEFPEKFDDYESGIGETKLNDNYAIRLRQIRQSEYFVKKWESTHLRHKPYKAITDFEETQKMLGEKMKTVERQEEEDKIIETEITFKDKTKRRFDWTFKDGFKAYFPELNVLLSESEAGGDWQIDLNDSREEATKGNPYYHAVSPDRKLRINGYYPGGAADDSEYWLEKWNPKEKKYEFVAFLENHRLFYYSHSWFWTSNNRVLFKHGWRDYAYFEMEIIVK
jgi:hypothetical protein